MPGHIRTPSRIRNRSVASLKGRRAPRRTPLATALASLALVGAGAAHAQPAAFSSGWFAAKGAAQANTAVTGRLPNGQPALGLPDGARQSQAAREQLQRSVGNLGAPPRRSPRSRRRSARPAMPRPPRAARRRTAWRRAVSRWTPIP